MFLHLDSFHSTICEVGGLSCNDLHCFCFKYFACEVYFMHGDECN